MRCYSLNTKPHIAQAISALEDWRRHNAHLYKLDPEAQVPLRSDIRIYTIQVS